MKFSEAVLLGSTILEPIPYFRQLKGRGCALGMAEVAVKPFKAEVAWPWLHNQATPLPPCGCKTFKENVGWKIFYPIDNPQYTAYVAHIFNEHVCGDKTWSLETLVDWIRSVEPDEPIKKPVASTFTKTVEV